MNESASRRARDAYSFGNRASFAIARTRVTRAGRIDADTLTLTRPEIDPADFRRALEDVDRSWRVVRDRETGKTFEIAEANLSAPRDGGVDAEISTVGSSLSGNRGNAAEFAAHAALRPDRPRLCIASFGNGGGVLRWFFGTEARQVKAPDTGPLAALRRRRLRCDRADAASAAGG